MERARASSVEVIAEPNVRRELSNAYSLSVGDVLDGKFRVERIVGEGGMGLVVAAIHLGLDEHVALKLLHPEARRNPEAVARFFQEARAAAKLKSEHVARVLDVCEREDGAPFIVMELLRGCDLRFLLGEHGPLPIEDVADYMIQACEGLADAHARGIVHRDIKPENLFLTERSEGWRIVKILDFGISKAGLNASGGSASNIRTGAIMGSPAYMSPEQLRETATVDRRTDLWALGAVMYELLTGRPPFDSDLPLTALILEIIQSEPISLRARRAHVPKELEAIVARCLTKDRDARFATAAELAIALLPFAPGRSRVAAERALAVTKEAGMSATIAMPVSSPPRYSGRAAGLARTTLALDVQMPPISSRQIITHPDVNEGDLARPRAWTDKLAAAVVTLALVLVVTVAATVTGSAAGSRESASRSRIAPSHVLTPTYQARSADDVEPTEAIKESAPPPKRTAPRATYIDVSPSSGDPSLEIRGSR